MPKTTDIFFAGDVSPSSTVRSEGVKELLALREEGIVVDYPEQRIAHDEFARRLASAWLAWSPSGYGWDCYRHYESGLLGTVALANYPTIHATGRSRKARTVSITRPNRAGSPPPCAPRSPTRRSWRAWPKPRASMCSLITRRGRGSNMW